MYIIKESYKIYEIVNDYDGFEGFMLGKSGHIFKIKGQRIINIKIINKDLAAPLVKKVIFNKYESLIKMLTELLTTDDDTGTTLIEALNRIEKFRQLVKNKYRNYLKKKELDFMARELRNMQNEAKRRYLELSNNYYYKNEINKSGKAR